MIELGTVLKLTLLAVIIFVGINLVQFYPAMRLLGLVAILLAALWIVWPMLPVRKQKDESSRGLRWPWK